MWYRLLYAFVGSAAITITMFLGMSEVVELFQRRDPTRYFQIVDFFPSSKERRLPDLVLPEAQPERAVVDPLSTERAVIDAVPSFSDEAPVTVDPLPPELEQPADP